ARLLADRLRALSFEAEIASVLEEAARRPLELSSARLAPVDSIPPEHWPATTLDGETVELDPRSPGSQELPLPGAEVLIPVSTLGRVTHVLLVAPGANRPALVSHDLSYLAAIAIQCGQRLDALQREREAVERQSREALLLQQVTEAELR